MKNSWILLLLASIGTTLTAWLLPDFRLHIPWLLLGVQIGIDTINRPFLLISGLVWIIACLYAYRSWHELEQPGYQRSGYYLVFFGTLIAVISQDLVTFYSAFALMSVSATLLITINDRAQSKKAGRIYLSFTIFGELMLFAALVGLVNLTNSIEFPQPNVGEIPGWIVLMILFGFGVKIGLFPLHFTLPVIYKAAPHANGIVLAGAAINIGLLGWMRWLPKAEPIPEVALLLMTLGIIGYLYAIVMGLLQTHPRSLLGYSSISQMCLISIVIGVFLYQPALWAVLTTILLLVITHHAVAKTFLFAASYGIPTRSIDKTIWWCGVFIAALGLAGAPLTAGIYGKDLLKQTTELVPEFELVAYSLWLSSIFTLFLMFRFVWLMRTMPSMAQDNVSRSGFFVSVLWLVVITGFALINNADWSFDAFMTGLPILLALLAWAIWWKFNGNKFVRENLHLYDHFETTNPGSTLLDYSRNAFGQMNTRLEHITSKIYLNRTALSGMFKSSDIDSPAPRWFSSSSLILLFIVLMIVGITFL